MKPYKLEPQATYKDQVEAQLQWWKKFKAEITDQLDEATLYEVIVALQEDYKKATRKISYFKQELVKCDSALLWKDGE